MSTNLLVIATITVMVTVPLAWLALKSKRSTFDWLLATLLPWTQVGAVCFLLFEECRSNQDAWVLLVTMAGGLALVASNLLLARVLNGMHEREMLAAKEKLIAEQIAAQEDHYSKLNENIRQATHLDEGIVASLNAAREMLANQEQSQAVMELDRAASMVRTPRARFCANTVVDALLASKARTCEEEGINATFDVVVNNETSLSGAVLCAVFANMTDNAINACRQVEEGARTLTLTARQSRGCLVVRTENPLPAGTEQHAGFHPLAHTPAAALGKTPLAEHGWGLTILQAIADTHGGTFEAQALDGSFTASLVIMDRPEKGGPAH